MLARKGSLLRWCSEQDLLTRNKIISISRQGHVRKKNIIEVCAATGEQTTGSLLV